MSNVKISALPAATTPLAGTEILPIVQSGTTSKVSVADLTSGRAISAYSVTDATLTSGRVTYAGTAGLLQDSANLLFNGTTLTANTLNLTNALGIAYGGTGQITANASFNALAPSQTGNSGKYLTTDGANTSWATNPLGTVTSITAGTGLTGGTITTSGTIAIDTSVVATLTGTQTLTNKTISGASNTLSNIGNASLTNSAITINGTSTSLGGSISVGTVTSVTGTAPVSVATGTSTPVISMAAANTSTNGYLSSTDWNTFNNKQASGTYVNSVSATAPITSTGGVTPTIAIPVATSSANGYLSSTDWTTFNNKGSGNGTVTSVAALTLGTTGTDLSSTVANGTTSPVITLQVPTASATNRGALSSADWTTFNGKANAFTYTTNYIPYGQGTTTPTQSANLTFNGTTLTTTGISTSNNLTFTGTGNRITGDFNNATLTNRVAFQTSTVNTATAVGFIPNGTSALTQIQLYSNSDPTNSSRLTIFNNNTTCSVNADISGTGTYLPLTMNTGGSERLRIDTSGNVGIGTSTVSYKLTLQETGGSTFNREYVLRNGDQTNFWRLSQGRNLTTATSGIPANAAFIATENGGGYGASGGLALGTIDSAPLVAITAGAERMRIDSSGNVGIGTSSPSTKLHVSGGRSSFVANSDAYALSVGYASIGAYYIGANSGNDSLLFSNSAGSEKMRIDSSGNLLVNGTTVRNSGIVSIDYNGSTNGGMGINDTASANGSALIAFLTGGTFRASITNNNNTGVLYNVTSDYRLKTVIGSVSDSGQRIDALEPIEYEWNEGGRTKGFLAHKFAEIYPNSVSGEKDAVDKDGKPVYQGMQASTPEVMADLIAEIQSLRKRVAIAEEQQALIESLTTRLTALENK